MDCVRAEIELFSVWRWTDIVFVLVGIDLVFRCGPQIA